MKTIMVRMPEELIPCNESSRGQDRQPVTNGRRGSAHGVSKGGAQARRGGVAMARWGQGSVFKRGNIWWFQDYRHGKAYNENSRSDSQRIAQRLLRQRMGEITSAKFVGPSEERLTFEDIATDLTRDYGDQRAPGDRLYYLASAPAEVLRH